MYLFHTSVQTGSEAHTTAYRRDSRVFFPDVKRPGREANHSLPSTAEEKVGGAISPFPHMFHGFNTNNLRFTLPYSEVLRQSQLNFFIGFRI
jgi:hypothetical protein